MLSQTCHFMRKRLMVYNLLLPFKYNLLVTCAEFGYKGLIIWLTKTQGVKYPKGTSQGERKILITAATKTDDFRFYKWIVKELRFNGKINFYGMIERDCVKILQGLQYIPDCYDIDKAFCSGSCKVLQLYAKEAEIRWKTYKCDNIHPKSLEWLYNRGISIDDMFFSYSAWEVPEDSIESWGTWLWNASCKNWSYQMAAVHLLKTKRFLYHYTSVIWLLKRTPVTIEMVTACDDDYDAIGLLWKFDRTLVYDYLIKNNKDKLMLQMKERLKINFEPQTKKLKV